MSHTGRINVLIACSGTKLAKPAPARSLYCSDLFRKSLAWAQALGADQTMVLSAKHGVVQLDETLAPYDLTLTNMTAAERLKWGERTWAALAPLIHPGDAIVFLAGLRYREHLIPRMFAHGIDRQMILAPLQGMGIGQQKRWLALSNPRETVASLGGLDAAAYAG